jgi:hypothetical protein
VARYLVTERISQELNLHQLYINFLHELDEPQFDKLVLLETYNHSKVLSGSLWEMVGGTSPMCN